MAEFFEDGNLAFQIVYMPLGFFFIFGVHFNYFESKFFHRIILHTAINLAIGSFA
jgi:hypothetical protein